MWDGVIEYHSISQLSEFSTNKVVAIAWGVTKIAGNYIKCHNSARYWDWLVSRDCRPSDCQFFLVNVVLCENNGCRDEDFGWLEQLWTLWQLWLHQVVNLSLIMRSYLRGDVACQNWSIIDCKTAFHREGPVLLYLWSFTIKLTIFT